MIKKCRRYGRRERVIIILCTFIAAIIPVTVYMYFSRQECKDKSELINQQLASYEKAVYVASKSLPKGTVLTEDILDKQIRYSDYLQDKFISEEDFGKVLSLDIDEGTCIMNDMVYISGHNSREFFLENVEIPEHIQEGDRVDIRIRYGNAEEYIVLSDKVILNSPEENGMVLHLDAEELLMISSATTDTDLFTKTKMYVVEYPEYANAEKSPVTYIPNKDVLLLLKREKAEGESRTALEQRLLQSGQ